MNAFRKTSLLVLVALVAVIVLGVFESSATAGGCHSSSYGSYSNFCNYPTTSKYCYGNTCYYPTSCYSGSCYFPTTTYNCIKPVSYPVTFYDCYGRPYVVWQTSYSYQP